MKSVKTLTAALILVVLAGCTTFRAYQRAQDLEEAKDWDAAAIEYAKALEIDPDNVRYKMGLQRARLEASRVHFEKAKALKLAGKIEMAVVELQIAANLDPTNQYAAVELTKAVRELEASRQPPETIAEMKKRASGKAQPPQLNPASDEPISLSFPRETSVKDIYRALGNSFGINILFDQAVKDDRIVIELRDVTAQQALERVMQAANHFYKVLDERTIIVIPDNPQARRDYEDLVIQTFYLSNGDAEQVTNVVRTMIEARNVFPLKALNAITIRDTADKVRIAEKIIEANDKARAEVVVDVELTQLDIEKLRDFGLQISGGKGGGVINVLDGAGAALTGGVTVGDLSSIGKDNVSFTMPSAAYGLFKSSGDIRLLAKPQLRISEGEKASLHIGQKIPVPVSTFTAANTGGTGTYAPVTSYQYQDIGIKITMEPRVHHNREVTLKLTVEVSNVADAGTATQGQPAQPTIGTRTIESTIRLKDGETNFLAGLIRNDDSESRGTTPFLGDIPLIGRLFTKESETSRRTDLVLTMTPHIIRIADITEDDVAPMWVGTQANLTFRGVSPRMESPNNGDPFARRAAPDDQFGAPNAAGEFPVQQEAAPNPIYLPPGTPPADPFEQPKPRELPPPPPEGGDEDDPERQKIQQQSNATDSGIFPRIAPQPSTLSLAPGEMKQWKVVGMDVEGIRTDGISMQYDPRSIQVANVVLGSSLAFDPAAPPAVTIDAAKGIISIRPTNGTPLLFRSGGEILTLEVRGALPGETYLVLGEMNATRNGAAAPVVISGGRSRVE